MMSMLLERVEALWHVAGWTMVHFMWIGLAGLLLAAMVRLLLRHADPNHRYLAMLGCFALVASAPIAITIVAPGIELFQNHSTGLVSVPLNWDRVSDTERGMWNGRPGIEAEKATGDPIRGKQRKFLAQGATPDLAVKGKSPHGSPTLRVENEANSRMVPRPKRGDLLDTSLGERRSWSHASRRTWNGKSFPRGAWNNDISLRSVWSSYWLSCRGAWDSWIPYLPFLWVIGTPSMLVWLATGYTGTSRLCRASRPVKSDPITGTLQQAKQALRISRHVGLAVCDRLAAPILVGILRPMVLLPPAALTGWPPSELEMILLHEMAHVRRWDNLVNLIQRLVESILFFHPAIWIISMWIRRDREDCCDAAVLRHASAPPREYARTLLGLAEVSQAARIPAATTAAASVATAAGNLRRRIKNILKSEDEPMRISMKTMAIAVLAVVILGGMAVWYMPHRGQAEEKGMAHDEIVMTNHEGEDTAKETAANDVAREDLRYDGKTFDEWRNEWRTELKTERRTEAIRALAAFGARGYGTEAAETILQVVKEYDWSQIEGGTPVGNLKNSAVMAFNGRETESELGVSEIPIDAWLPVLIQAVHSGDKQIAKFAIYVLDGLDTRHQRAVTQLIEISHDKAFEEFEAPLLNSLGRIFQSTKDDRIKNRLEEAVQSDYGQIARRAFLTLYPGAGMGFGEFGDGGMMGGRLMPGAPEGIPAPEPPQIEYTPLLLDALAHKDATVRNHARNILINLGSDAGPAVPRLVEMLDSDEEELFDGACSTLMNLANQVSLPADDLLVCAKNGLKKGRIDTLYLLIHTEKIKPAVLTPLVIEALRNPKLDHPNRIELIQQLGQWGPEAHDAVPTLLPLLVSLDGQTIDHRHGRQEMAPGGRGGGVYGGYGRPMEPILVDVVADALFKITGSHETANAYLKKIIAGAESNEEVKQATMMLMKLKNENDGIGLEGGYGSELSY